jgi:hypothetical protein
VLSHRRMGGFDRDLICGGHSCEPYLKAEPMADATTGVESLCWGFKLQGLTWPFVELTSHFVQIGLRVHRQVSAFRKILS